MGYSRGHIIQLLYMIHDLMINEEQTYSTALRLYVIKNVNVKNKLDSEILEEGLMKGYGYVEHGILPSPTPENNSIINYID